MADIFDKAKRSEIMALIKGKNTKPELLVFRFLRSEKIHFQKHYKRALGNPDVALPRKKKAVFIDGDFWHGRNFEVRKGNLPPYWQNKIVRNIKRDREYRKLLVARGWVILRVWESDLVKKSTRDNELIKIKKFLIM
jgi:DNA mismatch endonuclease (patch repair protein)